jgi:hypothetical protein
MQLYLHQHGQQSGPFTEAEIREKLTSGAVDAQDLVWWEGQPAWVMLGTTPFADASSVPTPPPHSLSGAPSPAPTTVTSAPTPILTPAAPRTSGLAIGSLVCGLGSPLLCLTFIPAIILGHLALNDIRRKPGTQGRGLALTGLILGYGWPVLALAAMGVLMALGQQVKTIFATIESQQAIQQAQGS